MVCTKCVDGQKWFAGMRRIMHSWCFIYAAADGGSTPPHTAGIPMEAHQALARPVVMQDWNVHPKFLVLV